MTWVFDASAVLCWLKGEPGYNRVEAILIGPDRVVIHAVNSVEVRYYLLRRGQRAFDVGMARIAAVGIEVVRVMDDGLLALATRLKAEQTPIALGDVFAVALTVKMDATLLTTDRAELEKVARAGVCPIEFLR